MTREYSDDEVDAWREEQARGPETKAPTRLRPLHPPGETMQERIARLAPVEARTLVAIGYLEQRIADRRELGFRTVTEEAYLYVARGTLDRVRAWMAAARTAIVLEELSLDRANVDAQLSVLPASWRLGRVVPRDAGPAMEGE